MGDMFSRDDGDIIDPKEPLRRLNPTDTSRQLPCRFRNVKTESNFSPYSVIWLDEKVNVTQEKIDTQRKLLSAVSQLKVFEDAEECVDYVTDVDSQKIVLIISGSYAETVVSALSNFPQLQAVYVYGNDDSLVNAKKWAKSCYKVKGIYEKAEDLIYSVLNGQRIRERLAGDEIVMNVYSPNTSSDAGERDSQETDGRNAIFVHFQVLIEILMGMQNDDKSVLSAKKDLIDHFRMICQGNAAQERIIEEFVSSYRADKAIEYYSRETFFYQTLNKALRESDYEILFALRFFIKDLHKQLTDEYKKFVESVGTSDSIIRVYRGQTINMKDLHFMRQSVREYLTMQSFLSTSTERAFGLFFAQASALPTAETARILFQFNINPRINYTKVYANIRNLSHFHDEDEVLIMLGAIFSIDEVVYDEREEIWIATLSLCDEFQFESFELLIRMRKDHGRSVASLGFLMISQGEYEKSKDYFRALSFVSSLNDEDRANCWRGLGSAALELEEYDEALQSFKRELEIWMKDYNLKGVGDAHTSIANVYWRKNELDLATYYVKKAIEYFLPFQHSSLSNAHYILGSISMERRDFKSAIDNFMKSLDFDFQYLPANHRHYGTVYEALGTTYLRKRDYKQALVYYENARRILHVALPPNHPHLISLKRNIEGTTDAMNLTELCNTLNLDFT